MEGAGLHLVGMRTVMMMRLTMTGGKWEVMSVGEKVNGHDLGGVEHTVVGLVRLELSWGRMWVKGGHVHENFVVIVCVVVSSLVY